METNDLLLEMGSKKHIPTSDSYSKRVFESQQIQTFLYAHKPLHISP